VTISQSPKVDDDEKYQKLNELVEEKDLIEAKLTRCKKGQAALDAFLSSMKNEHTDHSQLESILDNYDSAGDKLHLQSVGLEKRKKQLVTAIEKEQKALAGTSKDEKLGLDVSVGVFAASQGEVEIALIYGMSNALYIFSHYAHHFVYFSGQGSRLESIL
jgi:hypothetical protein